MMNRMRALAVLLLLTTSVYADDAITCSGTWSVNTTEQALISAYGRKNVERGNVYVAEGNEEAGSILFPKDETRRVEIIWKDKKQRKRPEWIRIPMGSRWTTFAGIHNGMPVAEIEKINGRAFTLYGFDWDYGGNVTNWRGGKIAKLGAPCRLQIRFDRTIPEKMTAVQERAAGATSGETELASSSADLRRFPTQVNEIVIQYP
jgi:hypothetical protein